MKHHLINCRGKLLDLSTPVVMGILNLTPDSFYDGGKHSGQTAVVNHVNRMIEEGAAIIDIGAQSTRPGATLISAAEEWSRMKNTLILLRKEFPDAVFSVDTFYSDTARRSIEAGADMINDVSGGTMDEEMFGVIGKLKVPYILTHIQGTPQTMQHTPHYDDVVKEVTDFFAERINMLYEAGATDILPDPGFGFGKTQEHNYRLLASLNLFAVFLERPIVAGLSRKSMVNKVLGITAAEAQNGTTVLNTVALLNGASILRVHDVKQASEAIKLTGTLPSRS